MGDFDYGAVEVYDGEQPQAPPAQYAGGNGQSYALASASVESDRAVAEVQAAMMVAKRFERDENKALVKIMRACKRLTLAEQAAYAYKRGTTTVTGPSVNLARVIAQHWGNLQFGIRELSRGDGYSEMESYCWDLETNARASRTFVVRHRRKAKGKFTDLDDDRDIYELTANQGARRERACILELIPGDIVEAALEQCRKTIEGGPDAAPVIDRVRKIVTAFDDYGINQQMIEERLGHKLEATTAHELVGLRQIYQSLRDGHAKPGDFFDMAVQKPASSGDTSKPPQKKGGGKKAAKQEPEPEPEPDQEPLDLEPEGDDQITADDLEDQQDKVWEVDKKLQPRLEKLGIEPEFVFADMLRGGVTSEKDIAAYCERIAKAKDDDLRKWHEEAA